MHETVEEFGVAKLAKVGSRVQFGRFMSSDEIGMIDGVTPSFFFKTCESKLTMCRRAGKMPLIFSVSFNFIFSREPSDDEIEIGCQCLHAM
jgi:hypothetical protein